MMKSYSRNTFPSIQEILVHLFTCRLPAGAHCSATPSQTSTFPKKSFHFVNVQLAENRMCSNNIFKFSSNIGSIQTKRRISSCQFVKPPRPPEKCQVFLLSHEAPRINTNFKLGNQNNQNNVNQCVKTFSWFLCLLYSQPSCMILKNKNIHIS